jgi:hypothetical protein
MVRFGGRVHAAATAARGAEVTVDRRSVPLPRPAGWMAPPWPNVFTSVHASTAAAQAHEQIRGLGYQLREPTDPRRNGGRPFAMNARRRSASRGST